MVSPEQSSGTVKDSTPSPRPLPLVVGGRQRRAGRRLPADLVLLLHHAVAEGDEVALQDDEALPETLGRQRAFGRLGRELLLVVHQHPQAVLQLRLVCKK